MSLAFVSDPKHDMLPLYANTQYDMSSEQNQA